MIEHIKELDHYQITIIASLLLIFMLLFRKQIGNKIDEYQAKESSLLKTTSTEKSIDYKKIYNYAIYGVIVILLILIIF